MYMQQTQVNANVLRYSNDNGVATRVCDEHGCEDYDYAVFAGADMQMLWGTVCEEGETLLLTLNNGEGTVLRYSNDDAGWDLLAAEAAQ